MKPELINVGSYLKAKGSRILQGKTPDEIMEHRLSVCKSCEFLKESEDDPVGFCGSCGCGEKKRARLTVKASMPAVGCPKKKWGDADSRHPAFKNRMKSLKEKPDA